MIDLFIKLIVLFIIITSCNNDLEHKAEKSLNPIPPESSNTTMVHSEEDYIWYYEHIYGKLLSDSIPYHREVRDSEYHPFSENSEKESILIYISETDAGDTLSIMGHRYKVLKIEGRHLILDDIDQDSVFNIGTDNIVSVTCLSKNGLPYTNEPNKIQLPHDIYSNAHSHLIIKEKLLTELLIQPNLSIEEMKDLMLKHENEHDQYVLVYAFNAPVDNGILFKILKK